MEDLTSGDPKPDEKDKVAYDTYRKVVSEKKKMQERFNEMEAKLNSFETQRQEGEESKLKANEEYKKLLDLRDEELKNAKAKSLDLENRFSNAHKLNAFREKLPAKIAKSEYYSFVDLESIAIDPDSGEVDSTSVNSVVEKFVNEHSHLLERSKNSGLPNNTPINNGNITYSDEIKGATTQKEFDAIRKKHNR